MALHIGIFQLEDVETVSMRAFRTQHASSGDFILTKSAISYRVFRVGSMLNIEQGTFEQYLTPR